MIKFVCSQCGGYNIQVHAWIDANTHEYMGDDICDDDDTWCDNCEEHTGIITEDEFDMNKIGE